MSITEPGFLLPPLLVAVHSPRWTAAIAQALASCHIAAQWLPRMDSALRAAGQHSGSSVIVELPETTTDGTLDELWKFINNPHRALVFAVGDQRHQDWSDQIVAAGVVQVATSILHFERLWNLAIRNLQNHRTEDLSVEELVEARFPFQ